MTVVWCSPPRRGVWPLLLQPVMDQPGEWALVRDYVTPEGAWQAARDLRRGAAGTGRTAVPDGRWEFRSSRVLPRVGRWGVWARYLGPAS